MDAQQGSAQGRAPQHRLTAPIHSVWYLCMQKAYPHVSSMRTTCHAGAQQAAAHGEHHRDRQTLQVNTVICSPLQSFRQITKQASSAWCTVPDARTKACLRQGRGPVRFHTDTGVPRTATSTACICVRVSCMHETQQAHCNWQCYKHQRGH